MSRQGRQNSPSLWEEVGVLCLETVAICVASGWLALTLLYLPALSLSPLSCGRRLSEEGWPLKWGPLRRVLTASLSSFTHGAFCRLFLSSMAA